MNEPSRAFTDRQRQVLAALADWIDAHGYAPIGQELTTLFGTASSVAWNLLDKLRAHGCIVGVGRDLRITPDGYERLLLDEPKEP